VQRRRERHCATDGPYPRPAAPGTVGARPGRKRVRAEAMRNVRTTGPGQATGKLAVQLAIFDFPMLVAGFRAVIDAEADMEVTGTAGTVDAIPDALARASADVVVAECQPLSAPGSATFEAIEKVRAAAPNARIIALECRSGSGSEQFSMALKAGADGFITREAEPSDLVAAVRSVSRGQTYVSPSIVTRMVNTYVLRNPDAPVEDVYATLSEREKEVLLLAAVGHTNREIAKVFHLSEQTVHNYRANIMEKLGFHDRTELLKYAIRRGLISVADL
jgi:two-component system, NarL family, response regulator NreC